LSTPAYRPREEPGFPARMSRPYLLIIPSGAALACLPNIS
jgi:hypothetical protein